MNRYLSFVVIFIAFISPYTLGWNASWWKFIPASLAIITLCRFAAPTSYKEILGIKFTPKHIWLGLAIGLATFLTSRTLIDSILLPLGYVPGSTSQHLGWRYLSVFQVLNEELIFRALALNFLADKMRGKFTANLVASTVFAALHYVLYQFGPENNPLSAYALISLFAFALACNEFFLMTKSIAIPYALHLGWNINKFGNYWTFSTTGEMLSEAKGFNLIEGNPAVLVASLSLAVLVLTVRFMRNRKLGLL